MRARRGMPAPRNNPRAEGSATRGPAGPPPIRRRRGSPRTRSNPAPAGRTGIDPAPSLMPDAICASWSQTELGHWRLSSLFPPVPNRPPGRRCWTGEGRTSTLDPCHVRLVVSVASGGRELVQPVDLQRAEFDFIPPEPLAQVRVLPGALVQHILLRCRGGYERVRETLPCSRRRVRLGDETLRQAFDLIDSPETVYAISRVCQRNRRAWSRATGFSTSASRT
jgi:hypothetical protein